MKGAFAILLLACLVLDNASVLPVPPPAIQASAAVHHTMQLGWNAIPG